MGTPIKKLKGIVNVETQEACNEILKEVGIEEVPIQYPKKQPTQSKTVYQPQQQDQQQPQENFQQEEKTTENVQKASWSSCIITSLKRIAVLVVVYLLFHNPASRGLLSKIPYTIAEDGSPTFVMSMFTLGLFTLTSFIINIFL